jgi:hypothetical protein
MDKNVDVGTEDSSWLTSFFWPTVAVISSLGYLSYKYYKKDVQQTRQEKRQALEQEAKEKVVPLFRYFKSGRAAQKNQGMEWASDALVCDEDGDYAHGFSKTDSTTTTTEEE